MGYGLAVIDDKTLRLDVVSYMDLNLLRLEVTSWFLLPHARPQRGSADWRSGSSCLKCLGFAFSFLIYESCS